MYQNLQLRMFGNAIALCSCGCSLSSGIQIWDWNNCIQLVDKDSGLLEFYDFSNGK